MPVGRSKAEIAALIIGGGAVAWIVWGLLQPYSVSTDQTDSTNGGGGGLFATLAAAIQRAENVDPSANNPLALTGDHAGVVGTFNSAGVDVFDSLEDGLAAGIANLQGSFAAHPGLTINQWIARYITGNTAATSPAITNYQNQVDDALGVSGDTLIGDIDPGDY